MYCFVRHIVCHLRAPFAALLAAFLVIACGSNDDDIATPDGETACYMQLNISVSAGNTGRATRSPNGCENGDGREDGTAIENAVERVTVFLFKAADGINTADADAVTVRAFCWSVSETANPSSPYEKAYTTGTQPLSGAMSYGDYHLLAVANCDLSAFDGKRLSEVRDYVFKQLPYSIPNAAVPYEAQTFVMSSEKDATLTIPDPKATTSSGDPVGSATNPITVSTDIERLAARIDFDVTGSEYVESVTLRDEDPSHNKLPITLSAAYAFPVTDDEGKATGDVFYLTAVYPFNETQHSYLFKRVATPADESPFYTDITYLGDEKPSTAGDKTSTSTAPQENYVIDPYFSIKHNASFPEDFLVPQLRRTHLNTDAETNAVAALYPIRTSSAFSDGSNGFVVGYTSENTFSIHVQQDEQLLRRVATGLRFQGYYKFNGGDYVPIHYNYYLRHSDPDDTALDTAVMKYGVVRNNIYRVSIKKVSELTDFYLFLRIKVVPWTVYEHEEIVM